MRIRSGWLRDRGCWTTLAAMGVMWMSGCAQRPDVVYVAFGDSSTSGPADMDYVDFLPQMLEVPENTLANEGNGGETTSEGLDRLQLLLEQQIFPNAQHMLYWEGGNDLVDFVQQIDPLLLRSPLDADYPFQEELTAMLDGIQGNIEDAVMLAQEAGWMVLVTTYYAIPEVSVDCDALFLGLLLPAQSARANAYREMLNDRIRLAAADSGAALVDVASLNEVLLQDPQNYEDCNHLSASGNEIVAGLFAEVLANSE